MRSSKPIISMILQSHSSKKTKKNIDYGSQPSESHTNPITQELGSVPHINSASQSNSHDIHDFLRVLVHENAHAADQGGVQGCRARRRNITRTSGMKDEAAEMGPHPHGGW